VREKRKIRVTESSGYELWLCRREREKEWTERKTKNEPGAGGRMDVRRLTPRLTTKRFGKRLAKGRRTIQNKAGKKYKKTVGQSQSTNKNNPPMFTLQEEISGQGINMRDVEEARREGGTRISLKKSEEGEQKMFDS